MASNLGITIELKKGNPNRLLGKLIAYATVESELSDSEGNLASMVRNGILAVQANYVDQRNIRDFFQSEFGVSLEKGIEEIIDQAKDNGGLEGALDPEIVREKLETMKNMEFIPIPAKITFFDSEDEILEREEDIYYLGHFKIISHAHLSVNSFPILYQAKFREQEHEIVSEEIEEMLNNFQKNETAVDKNTLTIHNFNGSIKNYLLKDVIPKMLYNLENKTEYLKAEEQFTSFMKNFSFPEDTREILNLVKSELGSDTNKLTKLELLVEKIQALQNEEYEELEIIKMKLSKLD